MRKVVLNMNEAEKYEVIKRLAEQGGNVTRAALRLGRSRTTVYRMLRGYREHGKAYFVHGNRGRRPVHAMEETERTRVVSLYNSKYWDASYAFASELLKTQDGVTVSPTTMRKILMAEGILSPLARRKTKRSMHARLSKEAKEAGTKSARTEAASKLVAIHDAHARRPRSKYFGEMLQMDASIHGWFSEEKTALHLAIDDATGRILGAYFDSRETLDGYYNVFHQILTKYGIPYMFFTDRRTVFTYKKSGNAESENDTCTQFSYACHQLGVAIKTSSVPQAKGRVERVFGTLQRRLPILMRTAGVSTIERANMFLNSYIEEHNANFALNPDDIPSAFEKQPGKAKINLTLAVLSPRTICDGHAVTFMNNLYMPTNAAGAPVHFRPGTRGTVIRAFDRKLFFCAQDKVYALEAIPLRAKVSRNLDIASPETSKRRWIPPMNHPWRTGVFEDYRKKLPHMASSEPDPVA